MGLLEGRPALRSSVTETLPCDSKQTEQGPCKRVALRALQRGSQQGKLWQQSQQAALAPSGDFITLTGTSLSALLQPHPSAPLPPVSLRCLSTSQYQAKLNRKISCQERTACSLTAPTVLAQPLLLLLLLSVAHTDCGVGDRSLSGQEDRSCSPGGSTTTSDHLKVHCSCATALVVSSLHDFHITKFYKFCIKQALSPLPPYSETLSEMT